MGRTVRSFESVEGIIMELVSYNVRSGGFSSYHSLASRPERLEALQETLRKLDADMVGLIDTFRWAEVFSPDELRRSFGYDWVYCIDMNDVRVDKRVGLTVLARGELEVVFETVRLATRDCIKAIVKRDGGPLVVYVVYLDDLSKAARLEQITSLVHDADTHHPHTPTVVMGDFNSPPSKTLPWPLRLAGWMADKPLIGRVKPHLLQSIRDLGQCRVVATLHGHRFLNAAPPWSSSIPTVRLPVPGLGNLIRLKLTVDYMLGRNTPISRFNVEQIGDSDHWPIRGSV